MTDTQFDFLDEACREIREGDLAFGIDRLFTGIRRRRNESTAEAWRVFAETIVPGHPVYPLILECPMARHAYEQPRGYPGDAELLDYLYRLRRPVDDGSRGYRLWDHTSADRPAAQAVRKRRHVLGAYLDSLTSRPRGRRNALSVACGHLREALLSPALRNGMLDRVVGLDNDPRSLTVIDQSLGQQLVSPLQMSVRDMLRGDAIDSQFDLVYSAGLYDYLDRPFATRLTRRLFELTAPGGRLLICNFVPQMYDIGYMEIFMGWHLIYRTEDELRDLASELPPDQVAGTRLWTDSHDAVAYLEVLRKES